MKFRFRGKNVVLAASLFILSLGPAFGQEPAARTGSAAAVEIPGTEVHTLTSSIDGQEYTIHVLLPPGYGDASRRFPELYLLDAQTDFPLVQGLLLSQVEEGFVPPLLLVGITWGGGRPNYGQLRTRDFTPTKHPRLAQTGNAANFLKFIKQDLVPFIGSHYRTNQERTLMGHSAGGLFTLYTLFHEPALFRQYLAASPSLGYDFTAITSYEREYASRDARPPARIFLSVGELEGPKVNQLMDFAHQLRARNYADMELDVKPISDASHNSSRAGAFLEGLRSLYAPRPVAVAPRILDQYPGAYTLAPGVTVQILKDGSKMFFIAPEGTKYPLIANSDADFVVRGLYLTLHFKRNDAGQVTGFDGENANSQHFHPRVK